MIWLYLFVVIEKILFVEMWKQFTRPTRVYKTKWAYDQTCLTMVEETYPQGVIIIIIIFFFGENIHRGKIDYTQTLRASLTT